VVHAILHRHPLTTVFGRAIALYLTPGTREAHEIAPSEFSSILTRHTLAFRQTRFFSQLNPGERWRGSEGGDFGLRDIRDAAFMLGQLTPEDHRPHMLDILVPKLMARYQADTVRRKVPREE
jgi:hypothetical protein